MRSAAFWAMLAALPAAADTGFNIVVSNRVTDAQPSATFEVWASFDENLYAFAGAALDFIGSPDPGGFSDPRRLLEGPGTKDGIVGPTGDIVEGVISGQLCTLDCPIGIDRANPILVWTVTWSTTDFSPRVVALETVTDKFDVYIDKFMTSQSALDELVEGAGVIHVGCYADCDESGALDIFDYLCFINEFNLGSIGGDCDRSGGHDLFDYLCFINAFVGGC